MQRHRPAVTDWDSRCPQRGIVVRPFSHCPVGLCLWIHRRWFWWTFHHGDRGSAAVGFTPCFVPDLLQLLIDLDPGALRGFTLRLAAMRRRSWVVVIG